MLSLEKRRVYLALGFTDLRRAIKGLSVLIEAQFDLDVYRGDLFVFCNKRRNLIKILYWDRNGFCLWQKRLEKAKFKWPKREKEIENLQIKQLEWLLEGFDIDKAHQRLHFERTV